MAMERLEKVELIREKCDVSYEDAKGALDANGDDVNVADVEDGSGQEGVHLER